MSDFSNKDEPKSRVQEIINQAEEYGQGSPHVTASPAYKIVGQINSDGEGEDDKDEKADSSDSKSSDDNKDEDEKP